MKNTILFFVFLFSLTACLGTDINSTNSENPPIEENRDAPTVSANDTDASNDTRPDNSTDNDTLAYGQCPEERSTLCTREYMPVCATVDTDVRCIKAPCPSTIQKTYANKCTACSNPKTLNFTAGACE